MTMEMAVINGVRLQEQAKQRKSRLLNLKRDVEGHGRSTEENEVTNDTTTDLPKPLFRSYQPSDENLKESVLPKAKPESVEEEVKDHLEAGKADNLVGDLDLVSLAPRKPDWDLKRDISKKLEKLEKRTQRAIVELIRERLLSSTGENLAEAVKYAENSFSEAGHSDED